MHFEFFDLIIEILGKAFRMSGRERIGGNALTHNHCNDEILGRIADSYIFTELFWYFVEVHTVLYPAREEAEEPQDEIEERFGEYIREDNKKENER